MILMDLHILVCLILSPESVGRLTETVSYHMIE
jgi:hypothetical protein